MKIRVIDNKTNTVIYSIVRTGYIGDSDCNRQIIIPRVGDTIHLPKFKNIDKIQYINKQYDNKMAKVRDVVYQYNDYVENENPDTRRWKEHKNWFDIEEEFNLDVMCEIISTEKNISNNYE